MECIELSSIEDDNTSTSDINMPDEQEDHFDICEEITTEDGPLSQVGYILSHTSLCDVSMSRFC